MLKIINIIKLEDKVRTDGSIYGLSLEITLSNNEKNIIDFWDESIEEAKECLYNVEWKKEILQGLERFADDSEDNKTMKFYERLMKKVANNKKLTDSDINEVNICMEICTVFKNFDYKTWVL